MTGRDKIVKEKNMKLEEAKYYLDILEKVDMDPELVFTSLFSTKDNTIEECDLLNLYYRVTDYNGLSLHQYIKKAVSRVLSNDILAGISIDDPTHINLWLWNIECEDAQKRIKLLIAQIDLYHKTYVIHNYRDSYREFIHKTIKKTEPKLDKGLVNLKSHLNMTLKDRVYLMKKDIKRNWPSFKALSYIWFYLFISQSAKETIRKTYSEREKEYNHLVNEAEIQYNRKREQQDKYEKLLPEYIKREHMAETYIREKLNQLGYTEKEEVASLFDTV